MKYPVGTKVTVNHEKYPGVWVVKSNGPKNAKLEPVNGGRGLSCPHYMVRLDDGTAPVLPPKVMYSLGETVELASRLGYVFVVIKDDGGARVNVAKLGGDGDRYIRAPRSSVKRVEITWGLR